MAIRTRSKSFAMTWKGTSIGLTIPKSYSFYTYDGKKWYPPYLLLAAYLDYKVRSTAGLELTKNFDSSTISDEINPQDVQYLQYCRAHNLPLPPKPPWKWKPVVHEKIMRRNGANWSLRESSTYYAPSAGYVAPPAVLASELPLLSLIRLDQQRANAFAKLIPEISESPDFSGLNFIWELKELKGAVKLTGSGIAAIANHWIKQFRGVGVDPLKTMRTASSLTLQYDFGLKPFVSDCASIVQKYEEARTELTLLSQRGLKGETHHYSGVPYVVVTYTTSGSTRTYTIKRIKFLAQADVRWKIDLPPMPPVMQLGEKWGLSLSLERIWQATPYSFLVDWILNIGKTLERLDTSKRVTPTISRYSETVVTETWKITGLHTSAYNGYTTKNAYGVEGTLPDDIRELIPTLLCVQAWSKATKYLRQPSAWPGDSSPFMHVSFPEWKMPFTGSGGIRRIRDGLSLLGQAASRRRS